MNDSDEIMRRPAGSERQKMIKTWNTFVQANELGATPHSSVSS